MNYDDAKQRHTPHFHVRYGGCTASEALDETLLAGSLPSKQMKLVVAWADTDVIEKLLDPSCYRQVAVGENGEGIVWPGGQGFSAKTMYENSFPVDGGQASRFISFS